MVTPDVALQRKAIFGVYAMLSPDDPATAKMNEFLNGRPDWNPFKRAEKETVSTEIVSVMAQTPETWQVDWTETVRDRQGFVKIPPYRMRALVTMYVAEPAPDSARNRSATIRWAFMCPTLPGPNKSEAIMKKLNHFRSLPACL